MVTLNTVLDALTTCFSFFCPKFKSRYKLTSLLFKLYPLFFIMISRGTSSPFVYTLVLRTMYLSEYTLAYFLFIAGYNQQSSPFHALSNIK